MSGIQNIGNGIFFKGSAKPCAPKALPCQNFYETDRGKETRAMNNAVLCEIKRGMPEKPKAKFKEDIEIFSSDRADMAKKWAYWVNPKSGKTYVVINKKDNEDGTKTVRVLDLEGNPVTEKNVVPKKVIIIDDFVVRGENNLDKDGYFNLTHKDLVEAHLRRNNPIASVECLNIGGREEEHLCDELLEEVLQNILQRIEAGEKIEVINCSFGTEYKGSNRDFSNATEKEIEKEFEEENFERKQVELNELMDKLVKKGVRVVMSAGNEGKKKISTEMATKGLDITGSLSDKGKVSDFSSARVLAKHYEKGEYKFEARKNGINLTGHRGADISYENTPYKKFENKKPEELLASEEEHEEYKELLKKKKQRKINIIEFTAQMKKFKGKLFRAEEIGRKASDKFKVEPSNLYYAEGESVFLTTTKEGFLVPPLYQHEYSGTSFSAPVRSAKLALNQAMYEILED